MPEWHAFNSGQKIQKKCVGCKKTKCLYAGMAYRNRLRNNFQGQTEIVIPELDLSFIKPGSLIFILGRRGSGKSYLINTMVWQFKDYVDGMAFTGTSKPRYINGQAQEWSWEHAFPDTFVYNSYHPELVEAFYEDKDKQLMQGTVRPSLLIFDDMSYQRKKMKEDPTFDKIMRNARHRLITTIVVLHDACDLPSDARTQVDYLFCFKDSSWNNTERLYKNFFGVFNSPNLFRHVFNEITEGYTCMINFRGARKSSIEDSVFYYCAEAKADFTFGCMAFWDFHFRNYNKEHGKKGEELQQLIYTRCAAFPELKVKKLARVPSPSRDSDSADSEESSDSSDSDSGSWTDEAEDEDENVTGNQKRVFI